MLFYKISVGMHIYQHVNMLRWQRWMQSIWCQACHGKRTLWRRRRTG